MNRKKILLCADAKPFIGVGDLVSFIYFSKYLKRSGWEIFFQSRDYKAARKIYKSYNIKNFFLIPKNSSIKEEVKFINSLTKKLDIKYVALQQFERDFNEYKGFRDKLFLMCVSGNEKISNEFKAVINWDPIASKKILKNQKENVRYFLGIDYVFLNPTFNYEKVLKNPPKKDIKNILITIGGGDEYNISIKILKIIN